MGTVDRGVGGESAPAPWHKDECVRLATFSQVWCAFVVITGAELTPIWMATSRENGGLGFTAVDIGAFGSVMGVVILVFAATLFSFLADRFGVTRAVTWALAANGCIYLAHPLAWVAVTRSRALTWAIIGLFAVGRGCMGPVVMGGVSLILNNSAPRASLGAVNGFAGMFTNLARAGAPIFGGALVAGMVHATRKLVRERNEGDGEGFEFDVAEAVPPTWWPFVLLSLCFFALSRGAARMPKSSITRGRRDRPANRRGEESPYLYGTKVGPHIMSSAGIRRFPRYLHNTRLSRTPRRRRRRTKREAAFGIR